MSDCAPISSGNEIVFDGVGQDWGTVTHFALCAPGMTLICAIEPFEIIYFWRKRPAPRVQYLLLFLALVVLVLWGRGV